jgi:hypothetical protein
VQVLDTSDPNRIRTVGSSDLPGPFASRLVGDAAPIRVAVLHQGNRLYVAAGEQGLWAIDVSDPAHPNHLGFFDTPGRAVDVLVVGEHIYVADEEGGVQIFRQTAP